LYVCQTVSSALLRRANGVITNIFIQNTGGVVAEWEVRLAPDQAVWFRALVEICVAFWGKNMTVPNTTIMGHYNGCQARHYLNNDVKKSLIQ